MELLLKGVVIEELVCCLVEEICGVVELVFCYNMECVIEFGMLLFLMDVFVWVVLLVSMIEGMIFCWLFGFVELYEGILVKIVELFVVEVFSFEFYGLLGM